MKWIPGNKPDIPEGEAAFFIVTTEEGGDFVVRPLVYVNAFVMPLADDLDDPPHCAVPVDEDGNYAWTGWFYPECVRCEVYEIYRESEYITAYLGMPDQYDGFPEQGCTGG